MKNASEFFLYCVTSGRLAVVTREAVVAFIGRGYSGIPAHRNNPEAESQKGRGPIPAGLWRVQSPLRHPKLGPLSFPLAAQTEAGELTPAPYGRSGFYIHGDNFRANGSASSGCIILGPAARSAVKRHWERGVRDLVVVPRYQSSMASGSETELDG